MSTVPTAAEIADSKFCELTDKEILASSRFVSNIRADPTAELGGVFWGGRHMSLADALQAEKDEFVRRTRAALKKKQEAEAQAAAARADRERQRLEFEDKAAQGYYRKELAQQLSRYKELLATVSQTGETLATARLEKERLRSDLTTPVDKLQGLLARNADLINVLSARLSAQQAELDSQKTALTNAIGYARRELIRRWRTLREPLVGKAECTVNMLLRVDKLEVKRLAERVHVIVDLDHAADCDRGEASWAYTSDRVVLAREVEDRFVRLETCVSSELHNNRLKLLTHVTA